MKVGIPKEIKNNENRVVYSIPLAKARALKTRTT